MRKRAISPIVVIKVVWISLWAAAATLLLFLPITLAALLSSTGNLAFTISKAWAHIVLAVTFVRPRIRGREKIVRGRSYVIISNHQSEYDILSIVTTLGIQYRWIIKKELRTVPLFGYALYASRNIFIDRGDHEQAMHSIRHGLERLPDGVSVLFFAEGTRSVDGHIGPFKKGGFIVALERGLPILPVTVNGSRRVLPKKSLVFTPGPIEVVVGDPIETKGWSKDDMEGLMQKVRETIVSQFDPYYGMDADSAREIPS